VTAGVRTDYASAIPSADQTDPGVSLSVNGWDGVRRFTGTQQLYDFPLAVIAGLSETDNWPPCGRTPAFTFGARPPPAHCWCY